MESVTLYYQDERSNKFYRAEYDGTRVTFTWGRRGTTGQSQVFEGSNRSAYAEYQRRIAEKRAKGYREEEEFTEVRYHRNGRPLCSVGNCPIIAGPTGRCAHHAETLCHQCGRSTRLLNAGGLCTRCDPPICSIRGCNRVSIPDGTKCDAHDREERAASVQPPRTPSRTLCGTSTVDSLGRRLTCTLNRGHLGGCLDGNVGVYMGTGDASHRSQPEPTPEPAPVTPFGGRRIIKANPNLKQ